MVLFATQIQSVGSWSSREERLGQTQKSINVRNGFNEDPYGL